MVSEDQREKPVGKPYLSCIVTLISNKLFNLDLECIQYIHKIYVVTAIAQKTIRKHNYTYEEINISKDENANILKGMVIRLFHKYFIMEQNIWVTILCLKKD